jgi:hypothetical protein
MDLLFGDSHLKDSHGQRVLLELSLLPAEAMGQTKRVPMGPFFI